MLSGQGYFKPKEQNYIYVHQKPGTMSKNVG